jgi:uncharacterized membrane protein YkvA (DUF1232 family)
MEVFAPGTVEVVAPVLLEENSGDGMRTRSQMTWYERRLATGRHCVAMLVHQAWTLALLLKDRRAPWRARVAAGVTVAYLVSPIQLIPSFIPVIGQMDDVAALYCGMKMIRRWAPGELIAECEMRARASEMVQRLTVGPREVSSEREEDTVRRWLRLLVG